MQKNCHVLFEWPHIAIFFVDLLDKVQEFLDVAKLECIVKRSVIFYLIYNLFFCLFIGLSPKFNDASPSIEKKKITTEAA